MQVNVKAKPTRVLGGSNLRRIFNSQQAGLVLVILVVGAAVATIAGDQTIVKRERQLDGTFKAYDVTQNKLLNADVLVNYAKDTSFIAIMAVGMTAVIVTGGIDLSVGSMYALAGVIGAMVLHHYGPVGEAAQSPWLGTMLGIGAAIGVALLCGLLNGVAAVGLRVHPFIITMGTMWIFRGIATVSTEAMSIGVFPAPLLNMVRSDLGLGSSLQPVPLLVMATMAILGTIYLSSTVAGRHVYAVGGNLETSRFSGLRTGRIIVSVYVLVGLCAGIATTLANGIYGAAGSTRGEGCELNVIAAAVVGGASLSGGRGTALGAVLGAMLIQLLDQSITTLGVNQNYNKIIIGCAIIVAVVLDQVSKRLTVRRLTAAARLSKLDA